MILRMKIKKGKLLFGLLMFFLLLMMFKSQRLYITWRIPGTLISIMGIVMTSIYMCFYKDIYRKISPAILVFSALIAFLFFYEYIVITDVSFFPFIITFAAAFVAIFLLSTDLPTKIKLLHYISLVTQYIVAISLIWWILFLIGIPLPHYYTNDDVFYTHSVYYLFLLNGLPEEQLIPRFAGMFLEPGHLGTMCCFLLHINGYKMKEKGNIILLLGALFSLSLAAYGLLIGGFGLHLLFNNRKGGVYVIGFLVLILSIWGISTLYNSGDNILYERIFARLVFEDGEMAGANRTSSFFDAQFDRYLTTSKVWLGTGKEAFETKAAANMTVGCAGWKRYFFLRGYIGCGLLLCFMVLYLVKYFSLNSLAFFVIYVVANLIRDYPLKEYWLFIFILSIPVLSYNSQKI